MVITADILSYQSMLLITKTKWRLTLGNNFVYKQSVVFPQNTKLTLFKMASNNNKKLPVQEKQGNVRQERPQTAKPIRKKNEFFEKLDIIERE